MPNQGTTEKARQLTRLEHYHEKLMEHLKSADLARENERRHAESARNYAVIIGNLLEVYRSTMRESQQQRGWERERPLAQEQQHRKRSRTPANQARGRQQSPEGEMFVLMAMGAGSVEQALDRGS